MTKRRRYLTEIVPYGRGMESESERVLTRLLNEVDERRNPKTKATVEQLLDRYLEEHFDGGAVDEEQLSSLCASARVAVYLPGEGWSA